MKPVTDPNLLKMLESTDPITGKPVTDPALLRELEGASPSYESGTVADWLHRKGNQLDAAIQGNAAEELPSVYSPQFEQNTGSNPIQRIVSAAKALPATLFGQDSDVAGKMLDTAPGSEYDTDANGNPVIVAPDGKRYYVNQPGLDKDDLLRFGGNLASYTPGGRLAGGVARLGPRMAAMGGASAATNLAGQVAGREEVDPKEAAIVGLFGAGGETIAPLYRASMTKLSQTLGRTPTAAESGHAFGKSMGLDVSGMSRDELIRLDKLAREQAAGAKPGAVQGEGEFGLRYTQGQKTGDFGQLSREEALRQGRGPGADQLRGVEAQNQATVSRYLEDMTGRMGGGAPAPSPVGAFERTQSVVQNQARTLKDEIDAAYAGVREGSNATVSPASIKGLPERLQGVLSQMGVNEVTMPATTQALKRIQSRVANTNRVGAKEVMPRDLAGLDTERQIINNALGAAANPADRRALTMLKHEYDNWLDDAYAEALSSDKIIPLREAQKLRAQFGARFEGRGGDAEMDRFIESMVTGGKSADELINVAFGATQVSKPAAERYIARLKVAFQDNPEALNGLRQAHFMKLTTAPTGERLGFQAIRNNILATERNAPGTIRQLYTPAEWSQLKRLASALDPLIPKGDFARSSGTTERLIRMLGTAKVLPVVREIMEAAGQRWQMRSAAGAMAPVKAPLPQNTLIPAATAASGQGR